MILVGVGLVLVAWASTRGGTRPRRVVLQTDVMELDGIYRSMEGPHDRVDVDFSALDWVTGYHVEVLDADRGAALGDEFFCHSQLQLPNTTRLIVNATGYPSMEFPSGFAMPVSQIVGDLDPQQQGLSFLGMVLNNHEADIDRDVKIRATIEYWQSEDAPASKLKSLYKVGLPMNVEDLAPHHVPDTPGDSADHCATVEGSPTHWLVPPGDQTTRRRFQHLFPVEATVHYATAHLHNHGAYARLTDLTTGEMLWHVDVDYEKSRKQIERIAPYSSPQGFRVYPDHEYELEVHYRNETDAEVDAMGLIDLYYHPVPDVTITYPSVPAETMGM